MQLSIHHNAYEGPRWFWGSGSGVWDYAQHGPVRAAVRPRHAQRLTRCARDAAPGLSSVEALQGLFRRHPQMLLQGREQYVLERARMGPSPEALRVRRQRQEERAAARAVRQQQAREALAEKRAQEEAMRLKDLLLWWAETREVREAAREAVVVAAQLVSEAPSVAVAKRKRAAGAGGGAAAGAGGGADAARGRQHVGLLRRAPPPKKPTLQATVQALPGAAVARWPEGQPGLLRHRRGGGAVRGAVPGRQR